MSGDAHNKPEDSGNPADKPLDMDATVPPKRKHEPVPISAPTPPIDSDLDADVTVPKRKPDAPPPPASATPQSQTAISPGDDLDADVTTPRKPHIPVSGDLDFEVTAPPKRKAAPTPMPPPPAKPESIHAATSAEGELDLDVTAPQKKPDGKVPPPASPPPKASTLPPAVVAPSAPSVPVQKSAAPAPKSSSAAPVPPAPPRKAEPLDFEAASVDPDLDVTMPAKKPGFSAPPASTRKNPPTERGTPLAPLDEETAFLKKPLPIPVGLAAGRIVGGGRFTLTRELGRGGMGVVWLARDVRLKRDVALKLLPPEVAADEMALNDLRRETVESQRLSHPHIMRIHDLYETPGEPAFISMEYVDGANLRSLLDKQEHRIFKWEFLRPLVIQLCAALDYAHSEKVIHRDLKPANLMLDAKGRLKLADFGIAATMSDSMSRISNRERDTSGTLIYMSPQQMRGDNPRASDDLYSLGATLFELLTSKTPFYRGDIPEQVRNETPPTLQDRLKSFGLTNPIPDNVSTIVISCLAKDAKLRPPGARWIMEQLEASSRGATVLPPGRPGPGLASGPGGGGTIKPPTSTSPATPEFPKPSLPVFLLAEKKGLLLIGGGVFLTLLLLVWVVAFRHKPDRPYALPNGPTVKSQTGTKTAAPNSPATPRGASATSTSPRASAPAIIADSGPLIVTIQTQGAELFTNGVQVRSFANPVRLRGMAGAEVSLEARLEGYLDYKALLTFPVDGKETRETISLTPKPTRVLIESEPLPSYVLLSNAQQVLSITNYKNGIDVKPGLAYSVMISEHDYQKFITNLPALKAGQTRTLYVGALRRKSGIVRIKFDPPDATITLLVANEAPVALGAIVGAFKSLDDLPAKIPFQLVIAKPGYISKSNTFNLDAGENKDYDYGKLKVAPGILRVKVEPTDANISVYYSARDKESFGTNRDVPVTVTPGVSFQVVAEHKSFNPATNSSLQGIGPGETADLDFGQLKPLDGTLRFKTDPSDSTYTIIYKDKPPANLGQVPAHTVRVTPGIPLQVIVEHKNYLPQTNSFTLQPGEGKDCDFGRLRPAPGSLHITTAPADAMISIIYPGKTPATYGAVKTIEGITPDVRFYVLAEHDGYYSVSNRMKLSPGDVRDVELKLRPRN